MLAESQFHKNSVVFYFTEPILIVIYNCGPIGPIKGEHMVESHSQLASVGSEREIETSRATGAITILGLRFNVQSPYTAGHVCTKGEARALNQKKMDSIRNHLAGTAKDRALTQADVDAYAASHAFGERTARRTRDPVEAEALELARRLVRKKEQSTRENTQAARELLQGEKGDAIRAQAAKRVAELKDLMVA
jgi:hypothetical protein